MKTNSKTKSKSVRKVSRRNVPAPAPSAAEAFNRLRCKFFTSDGRRCSMPRWEGHRAFCRNHADREAASQGIHAQAVQDLLSLFGEFKTYNDVNHVLGNLWNQFVQGRVHRRDLTALSYLGQLLLLSVPRVRSEMNVAATAASGSKASKKSSAPIRPKPTAFAT
jgi:hypothetical protein